jgi:glucose-1-phosphatase
MGPCNPANRIAKCKITQKKDYPTVPHTGSVLVSQPVAYLYVMNQKPSAVIFDFGGVLLNLDLDSTFRAFANLGIPDFKRLFTLYHASPVFLDLEIGKVEPKAFADAISMEIGRPLPEQEVFDAWNAMLADFRLESLAFVDKLRQTTPTFLYSNTNIIHYEVFQKRIAETTPYAHLNDLFHRAYYSHEMGMRKPHPEGYLHILADQGLTAAETLFVDDNADNIAGAQAVGLMTHHLQPEERIETALAWLME